MRPPFSAAAGEQTAADGVLLPVKPELPSGTVTFVFTDIEGSTRLAHDLGTDRWAEVLAQHARVVREALAAHAGVEVRTEGDSFFLAFRTARDAVAAAADLQRALAREAWMHGATVRVRIGMHTGENARPGTPESGADYIGYDVHRAARVAAAGHGGQVLLSSATRMLLGESIPDGTVLRDTGEHRLKDLSQPDRLFQLVIDGLPAEFPPLRTLDRVPNDLPVQLTSFIGRSRELAEARALLEGTRLLTLVGPGGTGKTRLSLELAAQVMDDFSDGVWYVRLAPVTEAALVTSTIAQTIGLVVPAARTPLDHVIEHLRSKRALLVLDNFEQVVAAAPDVVSILRECAGVKAIVTTRIVLRVSGEQQYPVPPLALPEASQVSDPTELARSEAIQLFIDRARGGRPDFMLTPDNARAIVGIVAQLDGLPLAIELAAARVKLLSPQAILERLASGLGLLQSGARDLPARQQTLRGAIAWSYDLLDEGLQRCFRRFSVFRGGAALDEISPVSGPEGEIGRDVLDAVSELVDQSLVRSVGSDAEPRFLMLETIREFAHEKLAESGERAEIELRHGRAYVALAESFAPRLLGADQKMLLDRLELEQGNVRAAIDSCGKRSCADEATCSCAAGEHAADERRVEIGLRLSAALWRFWQMRGHLQEGHERTERTLAQPGADTHPAAYLGALEASGGVSYWRGDMPATEAAYTKRLELARRLADPVPVAHALYDLSFVYTLPNRDVDLARRILDEAVTLFRAAGDRAGVAKTLWALSNTSFNREDWASAVMSLEEVVAAFRELDDRFGLGWALHSLGVGKIRLGKLDEARAAFREGMALFRDAGDVSGIVLFFGDFAELAAAQHRDDRALRLFGAGQALMERTGTQLADYLREANRPFSIEVRALLERTAPSRKDALGAEGRALSEDGAVAFALSENDAT